ncbi:MAG: hypothetical protein WA814_02930, partial [Candidatus Baltobacteraceae bacterium]
MRSSGTARAALLLAAFALHGCAFPPAPPRATSFPPQQQVEPSVVAIPISVRLLNVQQALNRSGSSTVLNSGWRAVRASSDDGFADVRTIIADYLNTKLVGSKYVPTEFRITARRGNVSAEPGQGDVIRIGFNDRFELELRSRAGQYICGPHASRAAGAAARVAAIVQPDGTLSSNISDFSSRIVAYCNIANTVLENGGIDLTPVLREPYLRALSKVSETLTDVLRRVVDTVVRVKFASVARTFAQPIAVTTNVWLIPNLQNATVR